MNKKIINSKFWSGTLLVTMSFVVFGSVLILPKTVEASSCPTSYATLDSDHRFNYNVVVDPSGTTASVVIHNDSGCYVPFSLVSWKVYNEYVNDQTVFASSYATAGPGDTTIRVELPSCRSQIDLYYGSDMSQETDYVMYTADYCTNNIVVPTISASCSATPSTANVGDSVTFNSSASGGTGSYTYSWVGTDSLSGTNSSVSKSYSSTGLKMATVIVTSGSQSATANCSATISNQIVGLIASCSATPSSANIGSAISWNATASGGAGGYTYSWVGTDSLSGNTQGVSKSYSSVGTKNATVIVTSGSQSVTANCSANISQNNSNALVASCSANPGSVSIGDTINWSSSASGGTGSYTYSWSGSDSLSGTSSTTSLSYSSSGTKNGTVTVTSGSDTVTANCSAAVTGGGGGPIVCTSNCGGGGPVYYNNNYLSGYCTGTPQNGNVGDQILWNVYPSGGSGSYNFNWNGSDGATGYGYSILKTYSTPGAKTMTVNISSGGESISRTCSVSIGQVLAYVSPSLTSVYLSEVPYTGLGDLDNVWLFLIGLSLWSGLMAFYLQKRKEKLASQGVYTKAGFENKKVDVATNTIAENIKKDNLISKNEIYESAICAVEDCARKNNAIISSDAVKCIAKECILGNEKIDVATREAILKVRDAKKVSLGEWIAIGEMDL